MKFFYRQLFVAFLLLGLAFNAKAVNDTLTIGEAFNWQVGDSILYREFLSFPVFIHTTTNYSHLKGFVVADKILNQDSVVYLLHYLDGVDDTVIFHKLDSSLLTLSHPVISIYNSHFNTSNCYDLPSVQYCDTDLYQGNCASNTTIDSFLGRRRNAFNFMYFEAESKAAFAEGVGLTFSSYSDMFVNNGNMGTCGVMLVYYKSGSTIWMDSARYLYNSIPNQVVTPTFHLSPNPTTDQLTITADNQTPVTVSIYSATGVLMGSFQKPAAGAFTIPVYNFPPAYYLLKLSGSDGFSTSKGFIVVR